jgi:excinuclease ABC subunit C
MPPNSKPIEPERAPGFMERIAALPLTPGVYIMRNRAGQIIYVGKAKALRNRVRTYFGSLRGQMPKVWRMVEQVYDFEYVLTDTELEALLLENQLIKKHQPRFNIRLKDDKTYPFIKVTVNEEWPRVIGTRRKTEDGAQYFGPYSGMGTVNETIDLLDKLFPFRTCDKEITGKDERPCLQYFMHRCLGPCASLADPSAYRDAVSGVVDFLGGKHDKILRGLRQNMNEAAEDLRFERAAVYRDRLRTLERVLEHQKVFSSARTDEDVIAFAQNDGEACVQIFFIRGGRLLGREHFMLEGTSDSEPGDILQSFMGQFYDDAQYIPPKVLVQNEVSDVEIIEAWLRERRGNKVSITVPKRGERRDMLDLAARNAEETLEQYRLRWLSDDQKAVAALTELQEALKLPVWPQRIECYDVAHLQGTDTAGAMVVFEKGVKKGNEYRRFMIRNSGNDDYASMYEMLSRRFKRVAVQRSAAERKSSVERARRGDRDEPAPASGFEALERVRLENEQASEDAQLGDSISELEAKGERNGNGADTPAEGWSALPDLLVIDGGKGQLAVAERVLREAGLTGIPLISLAKKEETIYVSGRSEPLVLSVRSEALRLLQRVRDEAHRFSNSYNRKLGGQRAIRGKLDSVPLIGPVRKKALLRHFGSIKAIAGASVEELMSVKGMDRAAALSIKEHL